MANPEHVEVVKQGAEAIRAWREANPETPLDLTEAELRGKNLGRADLSLADLKWANLSAANLVTVHGLGGDWSIFWRMQAFITTTA